MSPSPTSGHVLPTTTDRKTSSHTLLDAFRTLTTGRPKSASSAAIQPPAVIPVQPTFSQGDDKNGGVALVLDSATSSISGLDSGSVVGEEGGKGDREREGEGEDEEEEEGDGRGRRRGKDASADAANGFQRGNASTSTAHGYDTQDSVRLHTAMIDIGGGTPELTTLLSQLHQTRPILQRTRAAHAISFHLDQYHVSNTLNIWTSAEDLLNHDLQDVSRAGHILLVSCARSSELSPFERISFFRSLQSIHDDRHIDLRIAALVGITSNGRNVEALELDLAPFLVQLLRRNFAVVTRARKAEKKAKSGLITAEEQSFHDLFQYIVDVIKFNAKSFHDDDFNILLHQIISICKKTTAEPDIIDATSVINALMTYTRISLLSIQPCVELLSDVFRQIDHAKKASWSALSNILRSHLGPSVVLHLINILESAASPDALPDNIFRGAMSVLGHLLRKNGKDHLPEVPLMVLLPGIRSALRTMDRKLAIDVMMLFRSMMESEVLFEKLKDEPEWDDFVDAVVTCTRILPTESVRDDIATRDTSSETSSLRRRALSDLLHAVEGLDVIILHLGASFSELDLVQKESVIHLFVCLGPRLMDEAAEVLIKHCVEDRLIYPSNARWLENCRELIKTYLHDRSRASHLRILVAGVLQQVYSTIDFFPEQSAADFALLALEKMDEEEDPIVLESLSAFAVAIVEDASDDLFEKVMRLMHATIFQKRTEIGSSQSLSPASALPVGFIPRDRASLCRVASKHVVRMFIGNVNRSAKRAVALFAFILDVAGSTDCATDARICAVKLLFRLRATSDFAIFIRPLSESESLAAVLCRTAETAKLVQTTEDASSRDGRNVSSGSMHSASKQKAFNVKKPVPPLWFYPGPKGLPEDPAREPSPCLVSFAEPTVGQTEKLSVTLKMAYWLEKIIDLLQQPETDWEIYSYVVVHLGAQLANHNLFKGAIPQIQLLRSVLCDQIRAASFHEPPSHTSLKKADVAVCILYVLTMLISYHAHFAKSEEDEIVRAFILGIGSWDRTSKWCIHALSVCCHEMPRSVSKSLDTIIQKMSQIITQSQIAIHILEFLVMLARLPELYKNFREDEYKMVFGVSFRYLQYVQDQQEKERASTQPSSRTGKATMRHSDSLRELRMLNDQDAKPRTRSPSDDLPQYVYALAFHVITFWFMNLKLQDRPMYTSWIANNLTYVDNRTGQRHIEDQGLVTMDMMDRIAYSDRDETTPDVQFAQDKDGEVSQRTWIVGFSLLTIETAGRTGVSQLTRRRPSGTKYFAYRPNLTKPPRHQVPLTTGLAADVFYTSSYIGILPEDVLQEFYSSFSLVSPDSERPIPLPEEDVVSRAISSFDRNSTVDGHKVGVIYIASNQSREAEILANSHGSADYTTFIGQLGFLTRLKGATFNTQGLDRANDFDGQYAYCWRDRATEIVFHITTMMPTDRENDPYCNEKKKHIGNDFVNIVWNESGEPFQFDTFPSAFNYVYIVITPETAHSFVSIRDKQSSPRFYKVQLLSAPGFPEISPAAETKVVSIGALPSFVRLTALNASVFSLVWANREGGEHFSPWRNRLREIKRLRDKYGGFNARPSGLSSGVASSPSPSANHGHSMPSAEKPGVSLLQSHSLSHAASISNRDRSVGGVLTDRTSLATFGSDNRSRSSLTPSSVDTDHGE